MEWPKGTPIEFREDPLKRVDKGALFRAAARDTIRSDILDTLQDG